MKDANGSEPVLTITLGDTIKLSEKGVFFMRVQAPDAKKRAVSLNEASDNDITWG